MLPADPAPGRANHNPLSSVGAGLITTQRRDVDAHEKDVFAVFKTGFFFVECNSVKHFVALIGCTYILPPQAFLGSML